MYKYMQVEVRDGGAIKFTPSTSMTEEEIGTLPADLKIMLASMARAHQTKVEKRTLFDVQIEYTERESVENLYSTGLRAAYDKHMNRAGAFTEIETQELGAGTDKAGTIAELDVYFYGNLKPATANIRVWSTDITNATATALNLFTGENKRAIAVNPVKGNK